MLSLYDVLGYERVRGPDSTLICEQLHRNTLNNRSNEVSKCLKHGSDRLSKRQLTASPLLQLPFCYPGNLTSRFSSILTTPENTITYHNALCLSSKSLHKHCFQFLLGHFNSQEKLKKMLMQNFGVKNKEHYGMLWYFLSCQL